MMNIGSFTLLRREFDGSNKMKRMAASGTMQIVNKTELCQNCQLLWYLSQQNRKQIGSYFRNLDHLITLHHRKQNYVLNTLIYAKTTLFITKTS